MNQLRLEVIKKSPNTLIDLMDMSSEIGYEHERREIDICTIASGACGMLRAARLQAPKQTNTNTIKTC